MTEYVTTERITVPPGTVMRLSREQAADRGSAVQSLDDGAFEAVRALEFRAGETLSIQGDLGLSTMAKLKPTAAAAAGEGGASPLESDSGSTAAPASERGAAVRTRGRKATTADSE